jgi:hypothetical protein
MKNDDAATETLNLRPSQFKMGDLFNRDGDVVEEIRFRTGGVVVYFRTPSGALRSTGLNGRRKYVIRRRVG